MLALDMQQRIKALLTEAIVLLCKSGLGYKAEFSVEGLLGITLDNADVFLVNIKEPVRVAAAVASVLIEPSTTVTTAVRDACTTDVDLQGMFTFGSLLCGVGGKDGRQGNGNDDEACAATAATAIIVGFDDDIHCQSPLAVVDVVGGCHETKVNQNKNPSSSPCDDGLGLNINDVTGGCPYSFDDVDGQHGALFSTAELDEIIGKVNLRSSPAKEAGGDSLTSSSSDDGPAMAKEEASYTVIVKRENLLMAGDDSDESVTGDTVLSRQDVAAITAVFAEQSAAGTFLLNDDNGGGGDDPMDAGCSTWDDAGPDDDAMFNDIGPLNLAGPQDLSTGLSKKVGCQFIFSRYLVKKQQGNSLLCFFCQI